MRQLIDELFLNEHLSTENLKKLLYYLQNNPDDVQYLHKKANEKRLEYYGNKVFMRALIEFTNYCKSDCMYCGIRHSNHDATRYRLTKEEILLCCEEGVKLGYRTFVLQGGEDPYYTDDQMVDIISSIRQQFPECAITLSIGEKSYESYEKFYEAGADRYLLRHETHSRHLYEALHPNMSYDRRIECLYDLKSIGYQVGAGFMVGLPNQTIDDLVDDLLFLKELEPHMIGIGPFIPHKDTPLHDQSSGTVEMTCILLSLIRLLLPKVLLPATTALGSIEPKGREKGLLAGANIVMPNLSPINVRDKYLLYDGKICTGDEAAHCRKCIEKRIQSAGFDVDMSRGDHIDKVKY